MKDLSAERLDAAQDTKKAIRDLEDGSYFLQHKLAGQRCFSSRFTE